MTSPPAIVVSPHARGVTVNRTGKLAHPATIPASRQGSGRQTGGHIVALQAWSVQLQVQALLGPAGCLVTGGYGTWEVVAVPRAQPITQWTGQTVATMDLDLLFDSWHKQISVEPQIATLEALATKRPGMLTPPSLRIYGAVPHASGRWVISDMTWGDALRDNVTGNRRRQAVLVHLMAYNPSTVLTALPKGAATSSPPRKYRVKQGDDLKRIAANMLGASSKWEQIANANTGLRGWHIPASFVGKTIKVPPR